MSSRWFCTPALIAACVLACRSGTDHPQQPDPVPAAADPTPVAVVPSPPSGGCQLGPGTGAGLHCPRGHSSFLREVEETINELIREEPEVFDLTIARGCPNCYYVHNPHRLNLRMVQMLNARGLCTINDGEELAVKNTNAWNDQYDILTVEHYLRRQEGSYRATCSPAWF